MNNYDKLLPEKTIEVMAKSFYKETLRYGFCKVDYIKFINRLLDLMMKIQHTHGITDLTPVTKQQKINSLLNI